MYNKKAQEISPVAVFMALVGAVIAFVMIKKMEAGIFWGLISVVVSGIACYFIAWGIMQGGS